MANSPVRLSDVIDLLATPEEAAEYEGVRYAAGPTLVFILGPSTPESAYERDHRRCCDMQDRIWSRVLPHLLAGDWIAYGFTKGGIEPVKISPALWPYLQCTFHSDEVSARDIPDVQFFAVTIVRDAIPAIRPHSATATMRQKLVRWIEQQAEAGCGPVKKSDLQAEARLVFGDANVSENLFAEAWRAANVPAGFRQIGRPKA
jgi:hypothetical protein